MNDSKIGFLKNSKFIITAAVILLAAIIFAAAWMLFSGRSAREFYFNAESKTFKKYSDWIKKSYRDFQETQKPYLTGNYEKRTEATLNITAGGGSFFGAGNPQGVFDVIGKFKLIADVKRNPADRISLSRLSLLLEKTPFIDAEVFTENRRMYFTVPVLTPDRYFTFDEERIGEVYDRFGIPVKPERILNSADIAGALKLDAGEIDSTSESYGAFFSKMIGENDVKYGKDVELTISGQKAAGREVFVTLDAGKSYALLRGLAEKAGGDDTLMKLTYGNFADISGLLDEAGLYRLFDFLDKSGAAVLDEAEKRLLAAVNVKKDVAGFKKAVAGAFDGYDFPQGIKMKLVIDKAGNILDRTLDTVMDDKDGLNIYTVSMHTGSTSMLLDDCRNRFTDISMETAASNGTRSRLFFKANASFVPYSGTDDEKGSIGFSFGTEAGGKPASMTSVHLDMDGKTDMSTLKKNNIVKYSIEMEDNAANTIDAVNGEINTASWKNSKLKTRDWNTSITFDADMPTFGVKGFSGVLTLAREDRLEISPFTLPEVQAVKTVDLNTATDEEINAAQNEILASFGTFYLTNKPIIDSILGK